MNRELKALEEYVKLSNELLELLQAEVSRELTPDKPDGSLPPFSEEAGRRLAELGARADEAERQYHDIVGQWISQKGATQ